MSDILTEQPELAQQAHRASLMLLTNKESSPTCSQSVSFTIPRVWLTPSGEYLARRRACLSYRQLCNSLVYDDMPPTQGRQRTGMHGTGDH